MKPGEPPSVEPTAFVARGPADARAYNATVPFSTEFTPPARPFTLSGTLDQRVRAVDCMAAAVLYEAGDDVQGQRAVAQVIVNRVRHPAFPKTICGVVFQGSDRITGCQFTFTCDGALARRHWSEVAWSHARAIADQALTGSVFERVGYSTHYHTDWVVPYWQSSLDKVAVVHSHLFFRWSGWWGTSAAFDRRVDQVEPVIAQLANYSKAHRVEGSTTALNLTMADADAEHLGTLQDPSNPDTNMVFTIDAKLTGDRMSAFAKQACHELPYCNFMAWRDSATTPKELPVVGDAVVSMSFRYLRDRGRGIERSLWNCDLYNRPNREECLPKQPRVSAPNQGRQSKYGNPGGGGLTSTIQ